MLAAPRFPFRESIKNKAFVLFVPPPAPIARTVLTLSNIFPVIRVILLLPKTKLLCRIFFKGILLHRMVNSTASPALPASHWPAWGLVAARRFINLRALL